MDSASLPLDDIRKRIDQIDEQIILLLSERYNFLTIIASLKQQLGVKAKDENREQQIMERLVKMAEQYELPPEFIKKLYEIIFDEFRRRQEELGGS